MRSRLARSVSVAALVAATVGLVLGTYFAHPRDADDTADAGASSAEFLNALERESVIELPPLKLPTTAQTTVFFGDSWTEGVGAERRTRGFAYLTGRRLGLKFEVYGAGGTGYVNPGTRGVGTFSRRMATLAADPSVTLVVIQGGLNDLSDPSDMSQAVSDTVANARKVYSSAQIVVFGVMPLTADATGLRSVSSSMGFAATRAGAYFVSPVNDNWLDASNVDGFLRSDNNHPTTRGHQLLADRVVDSLEVLAREGQTTRR